jgi:GNAT acetyltransferase-like protein
MANHSVLRSMPLAAFVALMATHASAQERYLNAAVGANGALHIVTAAGQVIAPAPEPERGFIGKPVGYDQIQISIDGRAVGWVAPSRIRVYANGIRRSYTGSGLPVWKDCMATINLLALDQTDWERVAEDPAIFAGQHKVTLGAEADLLRAVAKQTLILFGRTGVTTQPWSGYLALDRARDIIVGTCGFKAPPDTEGVVEIAYFTFPGSEGLGVASAMAAGLVDRATRAVGVRRLRAHTLPERNASTRILEKTGFRLLGEAIDPEDGQVWRWERDPIATDSTFRQSD